ncbi:DMT family transporter [Roseibium algae]|uniref:DMT family transporter n=1 Tax=Roseibium algae TaxID=3123038 RepID=A0ABU8TNY9_9HYPH
MIVFLPVLASLVASFGWATGIVLAQAPARALGAFEFTRIQLIACSAIVALLCSALGYWQSVDWQAWPAFVLNIGLGIFLGNLAMIECLRRGGPRRTELLLCLKAPLVAAMAYLWLGEVLQPGDIAGAVFVLAGIGLAIFYGNDPSVESERMSGGLLPVVLLGAGAAALQGFGYLVVKPMLLSGTEPLAVSAVRLLGAALLISVIGLWPAKAFRSDADLTTMLLARTILPGFIGYVVASSLLLYAFANLPAGLAAVLGSLSPVFVLPVLWLKERRPPRPQALFGAALAVVGASIIMIF